MKKILIIFAIFCISCNSEIKPTHALIVPNMVNHIVIINADTIHVENKYIEGYAIFSQDTIIFYYIDSFEIFRFHKNDSIWISTNVENYVKIISDDNVIFDPIDTTLNPVIIKPLK